MATIEKRAPGQYRVRVKRKGYPTRTATFDNRADAQAWGRDLENRIDKHGVIDTAEAARLTIDAALARYEREITPTKGGDPKPEKSRIRQLRAQAFAARPLSQLRGGDLAEYRDARLLGVTVDELVRAREDGEDPQALEPSCRPVGANTIRLEFAVVSHLFTIARTEWKMEGLANPVQAVRKPKLPKPRDRRLARAEGRRKAEEAQLLEHADSVMARVIVIAIETAMRRGEIASIERDQIDKRKMVVRLDKTKNGDARDVPLTPRALQALDELPTRIKGPLLGETADQAASWISHTFEDVCDAAGIKDLTFHDLRHEATSRLFEKGLNIAEVAAITGHKTLQMLKRYTHLRGEDLAKKIA